MTHPSIEARIRNDIKRLKAENEELRRLAGNLFARSTEEGHVCSKVRVCGEDLAALNDALRRKEAG